MSSKKKNKKQKVVMNVNLVQFVIVKEQKSKWHIWKLLGSALCFFVKTLISSIIVAVFTRLPIIEALIKLLSF